MNSRCHHYEESLRWQDRIETQDDILRGTLQMTKQEEKFIQQLLEDTESTLRIIEIRKKLAGRTHGIKNLLIETIAENFLTMGKELNIQVSKAYGTLTNYNEKKKKKVPTTDHSQNSRCPTKKTLKVFRQSRKSLIKENPTGYSRFSTQCKI